MRVAVDETARRATAEIETYADLLAVRAVPEFRWVGRATAEFDAAHLEAIGRAAAVVDEPGPPLADCLFDYQAWIVERAVARRRLAVFAQTGLGKTLMELEWARQVLARDPGRVLIVAPLNVVAQTVREAAKFYGGKLPIEGLDSRVDLDGWLARGDGLAITNFEKLDGTTSPLPVSGLVIDECFVAGTMVDTPTGPRPIETIRVGDAVFSAAGCDRVTATRSRLMDRVIEIVTDDGTRLVCSENHPFFTPAGLVAASVLKRGERLCRACPEPHADLPDSLRMVHSAARPEPSQSDPVLRQGMLGPMANVPARVRGAAAYARGADQAGSGEEQMVGIRVARRRGRTGAYSVVEAIDPARGVSENLGVAAGHGPPAAGPWRERPADARTAAPTPGRARRGLESRVRSAAGTAAIGLSDPLQDRLGGPGGDGGGRGRRVLPRLAPRPGRAEGREASFARVASVSVHEQGSLGYRRATGGDAPVRLYDLEIEDHPSFSVEGILVHNSSILKQSMGSRRTSLVAAGKGLRWKLCGSATPAPNDRVEYAEHAYFLDVVRSTREFLAAYFVNRDGEWQLKAHGRAAFYRHLASWSVFMSDPKAYRFADHLSSLPAMRVERIPVALTVEQAEAARRWEKGSQSSLFGATPGGIVSRTKVTQIANGFELTDSGIVRYPARKPAEVARLCNETHAGEQVIVWVTHDAEGDQLAAMIPDGVHVSGRTARPKRDRIIEMFAAADPKAPRVLIAKTAMFGFGLNLQAASVQVWSSVSDSWERWWQAIRRSWRYGQERPVTIYVPLTPLDEAIHQNVMAKEATFLADAAAQEAAFVEVLRPRDTTERKAMVTSPQAEMAREEGESWQAVQADCVAHMATMPEASMDLAVFSPPFANLFTYSSEAGDMGNVRSDGEYRLQWEFFAAELLRVMRPGRVAAVHCMDVIRFAGQHGHRHTYDYPSDLRAGMERAGFTYHARIAVDKNPQVQAVRTKDANLLFATLKRDALDSHPQASECVLVFRKPGDPEVPVHAVDVSNREWIRWAHHVWYDIRETDVLNAALAKEHEDERHICALQLGLIERCVRLWTNPGETILDPFAGIGSTGWEALAWGRRFYGIELKESYFRTACRFLADREAQLSGRLDLGGREAPSAPL